MGDIVHFNGVTRLNMDPQRVLDGAIKEEMKGVIVIGYDKEGAEYFASSYADGGDVLWLLERMKLKLLEMVEDMRNG